MSGKPGRSGRKPRHVEETQIVNKLFPIAVSRIKQILEDDNAPYKEWLEAAKVPIYHKIGKPRIQIDTTVKGLVGVISGEQYVEALRAVKEQEQALIAQYSEVHTIEAPESEE
jgi:hypothetical protein